MRIITAILEQILYGPARLMLALAILLLAYAVTIFCLIWGWVGLIVLVLGTWVILKKRGKSLAVRIWKWLK